MKPAWPLKTIAMLFLGALTFYVISYLAIEHRRSRLGPWLVTFSTDASNAPSLRIDQPRLHLTNVVIRFPDRSLEAPLSPQTIPFTRPQPVPFPLPFGECVFMDTTFQPGTVVVRVGSNEIQLLPRVLTINGEEQAWRSDAVIVLNAGIDAASATNRLQFPGTSTNSNP